MAVLVKGCSGENVTPEVTAQTPLIAEIAEEFGVEITTPSGTNKQILQCNNTNLQSINTNAKKAGAYLWKKLTEQGGDFVDFIVSDNPTAYPDGGEHGGYWYKKMGEIDPTLFGCTKYAVDKFTLTSRTALSSHTIPHSLGSKPLFAMIVSSEQPNTNKDLYMATGFLQGIGLGTYTNMRLVYGSFYNTYNSVSSSAVEATVNESTLVISGSSSYYYTAGVEYTLITMA